MAIEIERKFLIDNHELVMRLNIQTSEYIEQGYLNEKGMTTRVRVVNNDHAFFCVKGKAVSQNGHGEWEWPIPYQDAVELLQQCETRIINKTRAIVFHMDKKWEIDMFHGKLEGLIVAEVELTSEEEQIHIPPWVGREVSSDKRYKNKKLSISQTIPE